MAFHDIPGNDRIKKILRLSLVRRRVPNSLLFSGPEGVGKHRLALELAKALVCLERTDDACGACANCLAASGGALPDVLEIGPAKSVITIDQIRELKEIAYSRPMAAPSWNTRSPNRSSDRGSSAGAASPAGPIASSEATISGTGPRF